MINVEKELMSFNLSKEVLKKVEDLMEKHRIHTHKEVVRKFVPDNDITDLESAIHYVDNGVKPKALLLKPKPWGKVLDEIHALPKDIKDTISFRTEKFASEGIFYMLNVKGIPVYLDPEN